MDAKLKEDWVKALRSGDYPQARGILRNYSGLCCIGVGYAVLKNHLPEFYDTWTASEAIGLTQEQQEILTLLNDNDRKSFSEIADYIEANL